MAKRPQPGTGAKRSPSAAEQIDQDLVRLALRKRAAGEIPNSRETSALRRFEKERDEGARREHYATVPKKHYRELSGRSNQVLNDQADRYGLPLRGATIDLGGVLRRFHDLLAEHAKRGEALDRAELEDPAYAGPATPMLERLREETWLIKRMERQEKERTLVSRAELEGYMSQIADRLRRASEQLGRRFGVGAQDILVDAIDELVDRIDLPGEVLSDGDGADAPESDARA